MAQISGWTVTAKADKTKAVATAPSTDRLAHFSFTETESGSRFLDWGCRHAWTSCMVRMVNSKATIEGCDIAEEMPQSTKNFAAMGYTPLKHAWKLPYSDDSFDRAISCGVLEHVPLLNASLQELHRVTGPGGPLLIMFLPNRLSYTEFVSRHVIKRSWHQRLYSKSRLKTKLLEHGFEPIEMGFHQVLPSFTAVHASRGLGRNGRCGRCSSWIRWRSVFGREVVRSEYLRHRAQVRVPVDSLDR